MGVTTIEWTDRTWNPVRGCNRISEGCRNCYAERIAARNLPGMRSPTTGDPFAVMHDSGPRWTGRVELIEHKLHEPYSWRGPLRVFANSMSDLFHVSLSSAQILRVFQVMEKCPDLTFQVLTKRPERMRRLLKSCFGDRPLPNVWIGVSVENQDAVDRVKALVDTPAAVRFVSAEPLLGPVVIPIELMLSLDWLIAGGESGPGARPVHPDWLRSLHRQCTLMNVPFFFKQWGAWRDWASAPGLPAPSDREDLCVSMNGATRSLEESSLSDVSAAIVTRNKWRHDRTLDGREWSEFPRPGSR